MSLDRTFTFSPIMSHIKPRATPREPLIICFDEKIAIADTINIQAPIT
jgi:hypothetical protein